MSRPSITRRRFLAGTTAAGLGLAGSPSAKSQESVSPKNTGKSTQKQKALVAITLDLEMSRNFPTWETTYWDYEKGNLNDPTKRYAVDVCRRVKERGGIVHTFVVGRVFEQEDIDWLKDIAAAGHPIGNHTYDHVNVHAKTREAIQFRFKRAPWLIRGKSIPEVIRENIELTNIALKERVGVTSAGFRTPGGFYNGITERPDLQKMLLDLGFSWVSSKYPAHPPYPKPDEKPAEDVYTAILKGQPQAQPFVYPSGLIEIPMSPISDIGAFRGGRWKVDLFLRAVREALEWTIENGAVFDFLAHPSCLGVVDPQFQTIDMICDMVEKSNGKAEIVDLDRIAKRAKG